MTTTIPDNQIISKRDGVGAYGLYVDYVIYSSGDPANLLRQERRFLVQNLLCVYSRTSGDKRAAWRVYSFPDHDNARKALTDNMERHKDRTEVQYQPLLVEMTESDMDAIAKGETPYGRFGGVVATEKAVGKIDDKTWHPKEAAF